MERPPRAAASLPTSPVQTVSARQGNCAAINSLMIFYSNTGWGFETKPSSPAAQGLIRRPTNPKKPKDWALNVGY